MRKHRQFLSVKRHGGLRTCSWSEFPPPHLPVGHTPRTEARGSSGALRRQTPTGNTILSLPLPHQQAGHRAPSAHRNSTYSNNSQQPRIKQHALWMLKSVTQIININICYVLYFVSPITLTLLKVIIHCEGSVWYGNISEGH